MATESDMRWEAGYDDWLGCEVCGKETKDDSYFSQMGVTKDGDPMCDECSDRERLALEDHQIDEYLERRSQQAEDKARQEP
jgi:hypothetical protein